MISKGKYSFPPRILLILSDKKFSHAGSNLTPCRDNLSRQFSVHRALPRAIQQGRARSQARVFLRLRIDRDVVKKKSPKV